MMLLHVKDKHVKNYTRGLFLSNNCLQLVTGNCHRRPPGYKLGFFLGGGRGITCLSHPVFGSGYDIMQS